MWLKPIQLGGVDLLTCSSKRATERLNAGDKSRHDQQCWADNLCENAADRTALQLAVTACESMVVMRFHTQVSVGKQTHLP